MRIRSRVAEDSKKPEQKASEEHDVKMAETDESKTSPSKSDEVAKHQSDIKPEEPTPSGGGKMEVDDEGSAVAKPEAQQEVTKSESNGAVAATMLQAAAADEDDAVEY